MRRILSHRERIDFGVYPQALFLLVRNPIIALGPLLTSVIVGGLSMVISLTAFSDPLGILFLLKLVLIALGLALATVIADMVWRRGTTSFDAAWEQTRRKAQDIAASALGVSMVVSAALYIGNLLTPYLVLLLPLACMVIFIYSIAACTIGGIPGLASLQASLDLAKRRPLNTILTAAVLLILYYYVGAVLPAQFFADSAALNVLIAAFSQALILSYAATVLSKRYVDISLRNM